jgi:hypothetical protein
VLRFLWALPMLPMLPGWLHNSQILVSIITIGEGYRRAQWTIIRIENEQVSNLEKYRQMLEIPAVKDD